MLPTQPLGPKGLAHRARVHGALRNVGSRGSRAGAQAKSRRSLQDGPGGRDHVLRSRGLLRGTACEAIFKDCLAAAPGARKRITIATKVGIRHPYGYYDHSPGYVRKSVEASLSRMGIDYVDLYQLHRPDPLGHPSETAAVLDDLVDRGLVRAVGVSNCYPHQVLSLKRYLRAPIVSNQISVSLLRLDPIYEGAAGGGGGWRTRSVPRARHHAARLQPDRRRATLRTACSRG